MEITTEILTNFGILAAVGVIAGFLNVTAGGGSSFTLPALIFLGLDTATANGTNRVAILLQNVSAVASFRREKYSSFRSSLKLGLFTVPGAIAGAWAAIEIKDELFKILLGVVMIGIILSMLIPRKKVESDPEREANPPWTVYLAMFGVGLYGGFIQVGVGFVLMASLKYLLRANLVRVNMHKVFIVFIYTIPAIAVFIGAGKVDYALGLSLAVGNMIGGWFGAKLSVRKGEKFINYVLIAAMLIIALKLFNVF